MQSLNESSKVQRTNQLANTTPNLLVASAGRVDLALHSSLITSFTAHVEMHQATKVSRSCGSIQGGQRDILTINM